MRDIDKQHFGLWDLAVLSMLRERPMHPYEMQRLLKDRHKDDVLVLKRGSLYHAINRLLRWELIKVVETSRTGRRPERTTYRITTVGEQEQVRWLQKMIAVPKRENSEFMASVSFLVYLTPKDALVQLGTRAQHLEQQIARWESTLKPLTKWLPRIHLVELEYLVAMQRAEFSWVQNIVADLKSGDFTWDLKSILKGPPKPPAAKKSEASP